jgi:hypothetical protein
MTVASSPSSGINRGGGRRRPLGADHLDLILPLRIDERRQVAARPDEMRLDDLQHEAGRDRRVEGVAALLEDAHANGRADPMG